ncbi:MAG: PQ-loop domain-containing transporter [bacterium]|nr:PQ-loop domain-containing transporter [bacterium]
MNVELFAAVSGVIASAAYFPEALKIYRNKSAHDISLITFSIWFMFSIVWLFYGIHLGELPVVLTYSIALVGVSLVFGLSIFYDQRKDPHSRPQTRK